MEEITAGVNEAAAAGQPEVVTEEAMEKPAETGSPATEPDKTEVAFARRLSAERQKLEQELAQRWRAENEPLFQLAESEAGRHGMTPVEWAKAVLANQEQAYYRELAAKGVDPKLIRNHPEIIRLRQEREQIQAAKREIESERKFQAEAAELFEAFPELDVRQVPPEVWQLREERGLSMLDAYLRVNHRKLTEAAKAQGEQAAIASIRQREAASTGPAGGGAATPKSAWDMDKKDFEKMVERAKRGEKVM